MRSKNIENVNLLNLIIDFTAVYHTIRSHPKIIVAA